MSHRMGTNVLGYACQARVLAYDALYAASGQTPVISACRGFIVAAVTDEKRCKIIAAGLQIVLDVI